jgi:hypothetical protein
LPTVDDAAVQRAVEEVAAAVAHQETEPQMNHARAHDFGHGEAVSCRQTRRRKPEKFFQRPFAIFSLPFRYRRVFQSVVKSTVQVDVKVETFTSHWRLLVLH